jgi:hypothetical protein
MKLIKAVQVDNFRSIRSALASDIDEYTPIVGLNSSGKSNVLRALNLFFNGRVDDLHSSIDMTRDLSDYVPQGKKKLISVAVHFDLSNGFRVPKQKDFLKENGLEEEIAIQRTWTLEPLGQGVVDTYSFGHDFTDLHHVEPQQANNLSLFTRAIKFRYIPSHTRPAELIQEYAQPLRNELVRRLQATQAYKQDDVAKLMLSLSKTGEQMFAEVSKNVGSGIKSLSVNPALPTDFAELAFDVAIQSISNGAGRAPELEGSGAQSFILLHFLDLVDRVSRGRAFGWVQGSIWALEEPESFLHAGLRTRFAQDLHNYAQDPRRQIFLTTHQDEFVRVSSRAWLASQGSSGTQIEQLPAKDALRKSAKMAITSFRHPLLEFPDMPIVIVEGAFDEIHLAAALRESGLRPRWKLVAPDEFLGKDTGGDTLLQYLKYNQDALASRPSIAPVLVLRDWETKDESKYKKVLRSHEYSDAITAPASLTNPELGESFAGIERYLPTSLVEETVDSESLLENKGAKKVIEIDKSKFHNAKKQLAESIQGGKSTGMYAAKLAKWLDIEVTNLLEQVPVEDFLG